jgi:hypothetical protein
MGYFSKKDNDSDLALEKNSWHPMYSVVAFSCTSCQKGLVAKKKSYTDFTMTGKVWCTCILNDII